MGGDLVMGGGARGVAILATSRGRGPTVSSANRTGSVKYAGLNLAPEGARNLAVATISTAPGMTATGAAIHGFTVQNMVVAFLDGLGRKEIIVIIVSLPGPLQNGVVHHTLNLNALVAVGGMVESPEDVVNHLVDVPVLFHMEAEGLSKFRLSNLQRERGIGGGESLLSRQGEHMYLPLMKSSDRATYNQKPSRQRSVYVLVRSSQPYPFF